MMITADMEIARKEQTLLEAGYGTSNHRMTSSVPVGSGPERIISALT